MALPTYALEYDEELDAVSSLEHLAEQLPRVIQAPYYWKWVILSLHNAFQGFMVLALQGTSSLRVLKPRSEKEWREAYESGHYPNQAPELITFLSFIRRSNQIQ